MDILQLVAFVFSSLELKKHYKISSKTIDGFKETKPRNIKYSKRLKVSEPSRRSVCSHSGVKGEQNIRKALRKSAVSTPSDMLAFHWILDIQSIILFQEGRRAVEWICEQKRNGK